MPPVRPVDCMLICERLQQFYQELVDDLWLRVLALPWWAVFRRRRLIAEFERLAAKRQACEECRTQIRQRLEQEGLIR